jgi:hypothetical protein
MIVSKRKSIFILGMMYLTMFMVAYLCSDCCNPNPDWEVNLPKCKQIQSTINLK